MKVLYFDKVISLPDATKIMKTLNQKKHRGQGYFFLLEDLYCFLRQEPELQKAVSGFDETMFFRMYPVRYYNYSKRDDDAFRLRVYREAEVNRS